MLFYLFQCQGKVFAFCKLEGAKALSVEHVKNAVSRYVLHSHDHPGGTKKTEYLVRREDVCIDHKPEKNELINLAYVDAKSFASYVRTNEAEIMDQSYWYTKYIRVGAEVFIPSFVSEKILDECLYSDSNL